MPDSSRPDSSGPDSFLPDDTCFAALGNERFVSLSTFRRSGEPVSTPVWVARDGAALVVTTPQDSGKVKRLRHDDRVELRPCNRTGRVADGAAPVTGRADILTETAERNRLTDVLRRKYRIEFRVVMAIERLSRRGRRPRVILRITR